MSARSLGRLLRESRLTLGVAESCTGGRLGDAITNVPGSSDYFLGGIISYSNEVKTSILGVDAGVLADKGAVSSEVALEMANGVRQVMRSDIGVAVTGIAGPAGGSRTKPVGLVYIAVSSGAHSTCAKNTFEGSRTSIKKQSIEKAIEMIEDFVTMHF